MPQLARAAELQGELAELRRRLHREPEVGLDLPRTQEKVLQALDGLPLEVSLGSGLSSVTAVLRGGGAPEGDGGAVLLRGDMDALPVQEDSGVEFTSRTDGRMHGCGHDLHTAGLVGAARLLADRRESLPGDVVFMFQPGEEGWNGAGAMIDEGVLEAAGKPLDAAYAIHVAANRLPGGTVSSRPDSLLAASDVLEVTVHGAGGHGSAPHSAKDPVPAVCEMVTALHAYVTRNFDPFDPVVVTVGTLHAGTQQNVIPETARFEATVRSFSEQHREQLRSGLPRLVEGIAAAHGVDVTANYQLLYPVTVNTPDEADFVLETAREVVGPERAVPLPQPVTGSEDFSLVLRQVPGAMVLLGAVPEDADPQQAPMNHSPRARFDDGVLHQQAALLSEFAEARLGRSAGCRG